MRREEGETEVRERLFRSRIPDTPPRVGLEVEFLPLDRESGGPIPPGRLDLPFDLARPSSLPLLGELASAEGWEVESTPGLPRLLLPEATVLSFEPGGQIELATRPWSSLDGVERHLSDLLDLILPALDRRGIGLLARGLDPWNSPDDTTLHLPLPRYRRMSEHYDRVGPEGRRMMRQSAGIHVNVDLGPRPGARWRRTNSMVPLLLATFANSPRREGSSRGWRSERSATWRELDPARTGIFAPSEDPALDYLRFAREAPAFLFGPEGEPSRPWREHEARLDPSDFRAHLTTLFPEVRPRGYLEVRCIDAQRPEWVAVAAAVTCGAALHPSGLEPEELGLPADPPALLETAGKEGVRHPEIAAGLTDFAALVEDGLDCLGDRFASPGLRERVASFLREVPLRRRDPGAVGEDWVRVPGAGAAERG